MHSEKCWKNNEITGMYLKQNVNKTKVSLKNGENNSYHFSYTHGLLRWSNTEILRFIPFWKIKGYSLESLQNQSLIFFSEKYIENAGIKKKFYLLGFYSEQTKEMDWLILLFLCSIVMFSISLWIYGKPLLSFLFANGKSHSHSFVQDNSKVNKANLIKFSGPILETFVSEWYLDDCISFSLSEIATVFLR